MDVIRGAAGGGGTKGAATPSSSPMGGKMSNTKNSFKKELCCECFQFAIQKYKN